MRQAFFRFSLSLLGLAGALWSISIFPSFWQTAAARRVSDRVLIEDWFRPGTLTDILARLHTQPIAVALQPELARADALIEFQVGQEALERDSSAEVDHRLEAAERKIRLALVVNPADSFLWLTMYSIDTTRNGFNLQSINYLDQCYSTGPLEGWIALRRNKLALAVFARLAEKAQRLIIAEFAKMVDAGFIENAMTNLTGIGMGRAGSLTQQPGIGGYLTSRDTCEGVGTDRFKGRRTRGPN
ncbi:hypothetical protein ACVWXO_000020 [Bradyrhizobium sp. LM2.7]